MITPILRVIIAYGNPRIIRYLILFWFFGVAIVPLVQLASGYDLEHAVFVIGGWIGYFVLGIYLQKIKLRYSILYGLLIISFVGTIFGDMADELPIKWSGATTSFLIILQ